MEWSHETVNCLRGLWDEGHSTAEIGRRLGVSKNSVVGKAHRLDLPGRPSPIKHNGTDTRAARQRIKRLGVPPLPALASLGAPLPPVRPQPIPRRITAIPKTGPQPKPQPEQKSAPAPKAIYRLPPQFGRVATCCWPIGEPGSRSLRFCDDAATPGRSYCAEHVKLA
jgi:GcrA cell cycle regulator